jgi:two-component system NtrC family response regulator/two-component system response regulator HydG
MSGGNGERGGKGEWKVLLVDDEKQALETYGAILREEGLPVLLAADGRETRAVIQDEERLGLVVLDLRLPDVDGLDLFRWVRKRVPDLPVVILTGYGSVETAVQALREGAYHYLTKPAEEEQWLSLVRTALRRKELEEENSSLRRQLRSAGGEGELLGDSPPMLEAYQWIRTVGPSQATVLVGGESGTGKELAARAVHHRSSRRDGPFVSINCGALPPTLLESELFGCEKGAFTGAVAARAGHFELADGGTIFLDEVGECSPELQVRLLRVLQEKEFQRIGGSRLRKSDFRMIAATNADLKEEIKASRFREDLYYRVNVVNFTMPPLRERREDIPLLAASFLEKYSRREGKRISGLSEECLGQLMKHDWPGNVRELQNVIERGVVVSQGDCLEADDLPACLRGGNGRQPPAADVLEGDHRLADIERMVIEATLRRHEHNKSRTARVLGISRKLLYSKIREYDI